MTRSPVVRLDSAPRCGPVFGDGLLRARAAPHLTPGTLLLLTYGLIGTVGRSGLHGQERSPVPPGPAGALGTIENPVQADGPPGEDEFLDRLRCPDRTPPSFRRSGSLMTQAPDGHILDGFVVDCKPDGPTVAIAIDMYHPGRQWESIGFRPPGGERETRPVGPFQVLQRLPAHSAPGCPPRVTDDLELSAWYVFTAFEVDSPAVLVQPLTDPILADLDGGVFVRIVVDTLGHPQLGTLRVSVAQPPQAERLARQVLRDLRFRPAVHHPGCRVRQSVFGNIEFKARK